MRARRLIFELRNLREDLIPYHVYKKEVEELVEEGKRILEETLDDLSPSMRRRVKRFLNELDEKSVFEKHISMYWMLRRVIKLQSSRYL